MLGFSANHAFALTAFATFVSAGVPERQRNPRLYEDKGDLRSMWPVFLLVLAMLAISVTAAVAFPNVFGEVLEHF